MQIKRTRIDTEAAWTARSIGGKAGLERKLTATELRAFDTALRNTKGVRPQEATADDFSDPAIVELTDWLGDTIRHGRGAALLTGITRDTHSEEEMERIFWGIGCRLGYPVEQSMLGDRLGHVQHVKDDPVARGYRSNEEQIGRAHV